MRGTRQAKISCSEQGEFLLLWAIPKQDEPMGVFSVLRDTKWEVLVGKVTGESLSHAFHGWATPLVRELPPQPKQILRKLKSESCWMKDECIMYGKKCFPHLDVPNCFEPQTEDIRKVVNYILCVMKQGFRVVWVEGKEFLV